MRISLTANSFNFVLDGLASGVRMMQVQVKIDNATGVANGAANAAPPRGGAPLHHNQGEERLD